MRRIVRRRMLGQDDEGLFTPVAPVFTYAEGWSAGLPETVIVGPNGVQNGEATPSMTMEEALIAMEQGNGMPAVVAAPVAAPVRQAGILGGISWGWVIGGAIGGIVLWHLLHAQDIRHGYIAGKYGLLEATTPRGTE